MNRPTEGGSRGGGINAGGTSGGGGGNPFFGSKTACQECQSATALYTCQVTVLATVKETYDKTFQRLQKENCCQYKGGNVLTTKPAGC